MRAPIHVTEWPGPPAATPALLVHGTLSWASRTFEHQRPLATNRRVLLPDRRGFGDSPDLEGPFTSDYAVDATDVRALMAAAGPKGVHLVGHSYGGTVAMLAAAAEPDLVRSLVLIEPCAHTAATDAPLVANAIEDARRFMATARQGSPEAYADVVFGDRPRPGPPARVLRAARTALNERPCWLADLPTAALHAAPFPKLVVLGGWETATPGYRPGMAELMTTVGTAVAARIDAQLFPIPGAAHEPQREQPETLNTLLESFWAAAAYGRP
ncbi:alpha/beta hydrolase [Actinoplanes sp. LDG1-06]|uniref:Alpha/beta hydrolase n=1 Tax=Paractinoplanes ovalisporus TaxID=2810368 RepID=A0ABS2ASS0_9ACTN|nr:alpha/beta hydrolase [Actinoplanes ovalisporus]MBM2622418.1 alpha/beta hydrolase [Actinoplanes ovalisporus]